MISEYDLYFINNTVQKAVKQRSLNTSARLADNLSKIFRAGYSNYISMQEKYDAGTYYEMWIRAFLNDKVMITLIRKQANECQLFWSDYFSSKRTGQKVSEEKIIMDEEDKALLEEHIEDAEKLIQLAENI